VKIARRRFLRLAAGAVALPAVARAQTYPARPVRLIVPFAPGGPNDVFGRLVAQKLTEHLGKPFYVENIAGASGNIGTGQAAKAAPDGYTLLVATDTHVINPAFFSKIPYDPRKDFDAVILAVEYTLVLLVNPSVPAKTLTELVALIKANPGKYNFASPGTGTDGHLLGELFRSTLGLDLVHVPYGGGGPAIASVVAGHTPIGFAGLPAAAPFIKDGKLRALAVTNKRSQTLPEIPTMTEAGYPAIDNINWVSWLGVFTPSGTPPAVIASLNQEIKEILALPEMKERLATVSLDVVASTPEQFQERINNGLETWSKLMRAANIKPE
jgi:tripartite-type tricarboxylate transporter receptor subunit TctC